MQLKLMNTYNRNNGYILFKNIYCFDIIINTKMFKFAQSVPNFKK